MGSVFSILSEAMASHSRITIRNPSRFGDFEHWGSAIACAMGYSQSKFLKAFRENRQLVSWQVIESSPVAQCIEHLLKTGATWIGTPSQLQKALTRSAQLLQLNPNGI
jgi:hypothetical protein